MSEKEQTVLRQLLGSLQWPAVQMSPHLQASTSLLLGEMNTGLPSPLIEVNKLLRFAKGNSDVHLRFPPLGRLEGLRLTCMFDAALGVRHDQSSQGGFVCLRVLSHQTMCLSGAVSICHESLDLVCLQRHSQQRLQ